MSNTTCSEPDCIRPPHARAMCSRHYGAAYRSGKIPPVTRPRHFLSNVDVEKGAANCSTCGYVAIRVRTDGRPHECMILRAAGREGHALSHKYGIGVTDRTEMVKAQGGLCAICGTKPKKLVVDHDHQTGIVRQLLCAHCNIALGFLRDDPAAARSAAEYLIRHARS